MRAYWILPSLLLSACPTPAEQSPSDNIVEETDTGDSAPPVESGTNDSPPEVDTQPEVPVDTDTSPSNGRLGYDKPGPHTWNSQALSFSATGGCSLAYTKLMQQQAPVAAPIAIITPGFARDRSRVIGWAKWWASWGFDAVAVDLCESIGLSIDYTKNANALADFASKAFSSRKVVLFGDSEGGMVAVMAALKASNVIGVFGLDLVDSEGLAVNAAPDLTVPFKGLKATASVCNVQNNGNAAYGAALGAEVLHVAGSGHCDFERPRDSLCTIGCPDPSNSSYTTAEKAALIGEMTTAFLYSITGANPAADGYWTPGKEPYDTLTSQAGPLTR